MKTWNIKFLDKKMRFYKVLYAGLQYYLLKKKHFETYISYLIYLKFDKNLL